MEKLVIEFSADIVRCISYGWFVQLIQVDIFSKTTDPQVTLVSWVVCGMWVLLVVRKVIFWFNILILQKADSKGWCVKRQFPDRAHQAYERSKAVLQDLYDVEREAKKYGVDLKGALKQKLA